MATAKKTTAPALTAAPGLAGRTKYGALRDKRRNVARVVVALRGASFRGQFPDLGFGEYRKIAEDVCDVAAEASDGEMDKFVSDCCGGTGGSYGAGLALFEERLAAKMSENGREGSLLDIITQLLPIVLPLILACF